MRPVRLRRALVELILSKVEGTSGYQKDDPPQADHPTLTLPFILTAKILPHSTRLA